MINNSFLFCMLYNYLYEDKDMKLFNNDINYTNIRNTTSYKLILEDLLSLGVKENDTIMVHSSLSSMGNVENGAITVILALCDVVGENGTILFPSFTYIEANKTNSFSYLDSKCCVGLIPETFRKLPNVIRSFHPTHSVCAIGKNAYEITKDHILDETPLGSNSPFQKLPNYNGKILLIGCGLYCNSFIHALEEIANVTYVLGDYKTYKMIDKNNNISYKDYKVHNFNRANGHIVQRYDRTLEVLDKNDYKIGTIHGANSYLIDSTILKEKGVKKLLENEKYFIDDPYNLL